MDNCNINNCNINDSYVISVVSRMIIDGEIDEAFEFKTVTGKSLIDDLENDIKRIAYFDAIDHEMNVNLKVKGDYKGYNQFVQDFENGVYNTDEELERLYNKSINEYQEKRLCLVIVDGLIMKLDNDNNIIDDICIIYKNSLNYIDRTKYKFLDSFIDYIDRKKGFERN